jgi:plastocyanin
MAKQALNLGASANDNTGDTLRIGGDKINDNFNELYTALGNGVSLTVNTLNPISGQVLRYNGSTFLPSDYSNLTSALDVNGNSIISSSDGNIPIAANGTGLITLASNSVTSTFGATVDIPTSVKYKNEYASLAAAPAAASYPGYFFTVDGTDDPYVNINITEGGLGDVRAKLLTEYSSIDDLSNVDVTTAAPTTNQILKWDGSNWVPGDDQAGVSAINVFQTVNADSGTTTANSQADTLTIAGGTNITTAVSGDTVTVNFSGTLTTTLAALTDTETAGLTQGDMLYWNGSNWIPTRSPMIWYELGAPPGNNSSYYTIAGPGFDGLAQNPNVYVHRGFTYAFDNSVEGGGHPFRIQSTQGLTGTPYTTGQSGSITNVLYWTIPHDAPNTLYYQCTLHSGMNGTFTVVN